MKFNKSTIKRLKKRGILKSISPEEVQKKWEEGEDIIGIDQKGNVLPTFIPPSLYKEI